MTLALPRLERIVESIVVSEGFALRHRKSRLQSSATQQRVTGLVVNVRPQAARSDLDRSRRAPANAEGNSLAR